MKKKLLTIILAITLCMSLAIPALAATEKSYYIFVYYKVADDEESNAATFANELIATTSDEDELTRTVAAFVFKKPDGSTFEYEDVSYFPGFPAFSMKIPSPEMGVYALISLPLPAGYELVHPSDPASFEITEEEYSSDFYHFPIWVWIKKAEGSTPAPVDEETPADMPSTWAAELVNAAIAADLVPQTLRTKYTQPTTRAEFAALAVTLYENVTGKEIATTRSLPFTDTTDINAIKAAAIGVTTGTGDGTTFSPDLALTREQAATMLSRLAEALEKPLPDETATFADVASVSTWAVEAVGQMQTTGVMGGVGENKFAPKEAYTREQSIMTIMRLYEIVS